MFQYFISNILASFDENLIWIEKALKEMTEEELWFKPNENCNSCGILCQHLSGNITQYIIAGLGNEKDKRKRILEFENSPQHPEISPFLLLKSTITKAKSVISNLTEDQLYTTIAVQGVKMKCFEILQHVSQHLYYHSGQLVYLNKLIYNHDLDLYAGRDLNKLN